MGEGDGGLGTCTPGTNVLTMHYLALGFLLDPPGLSPRYQAIHQEMPHKRTERKTEDSDEVNGVTTHQTCQVFVDLLDDPGVSW